MAKKRKISSRDESILIDRFLKNFVGNYGDILKTCDDADVDYSYFMRWMQDPRFENALQAQKKILINMVEAAAFKSAITGNAKTQQFILRNQMREDYGNTVHVTTGNNYAGPPVLNFVSMDVEASELTENNNKRLGNKNEDMD